MQHGLKALAFKPFAPLGAFAILNRNDEKKKKETNGLVIQNALEGNEDHPMYPVLNGVISNPTVQKVIVEAPGFDDFVDSVEELFADASVGPGTVGPGAVPGAVPWRAIEDSHSSEPRCAIDDPHSSELEKKMSMCLSCGQKIADEVDVAHMAEGEAYDARGHPGKHPDSARRSRLAGHLAGFVLTVAVVLLAALVVKKTYPERGDRVIAATWRYLTKPVFKKVAVKAGEAVTTA